MKITGLLMYYEVKASHPEYGNTYCNFCVDVPYFSDKKGIDIVKPEINNMCKNYPWCDLEIVEYYFYDKKISSKKISAHYDGCNLIVNLE